MKIDICCSEQS